MKNDANRRDVLVVDDDLAVRELLAEGQFDNDLLTPVPDEGRSTTNNECQEVK